jgi:hypothetical protein
MLLAPFLTSLFTAAADEFFQALAVLRTQDLGFDHAADQLLHGALAEAVDDLADGSGGEAAGGLDRAVDVDPAVGLMLKVALFLETAEQGADGGLFEGSGAGDDLMDGFYGAELGIPDGAHDVVFKLGEGGSGHGRSPSHVLSWYKS